MFTGIVQGKAQIDSLVKKDALSTMRVRFPQNALIGVQQGASIALNGCCLTVTEYSIEESMACFDVMQESLRVTNLGALEAGSVVNYERAAKIGDEIGGHMMSGHISSTIELLGRNETPTNCELVFSCPSSFARFIMPKGYVGLNGCSLTIGAEVTDRFSVHLIPETLAVTTFGEMNIGESVNLEIDPSTQTIVETVERYLAER